MFRLLFRAQTTLTKFILHKSCILVFIFCIIKLMFTFYENFDQENWTIWFNSYNKKVNKTLSFNKVRKRYILAWHFHQIYLFFKIVHSFFTMFLSIFSCFLSFGFSSLSKLLRFLVIFRAVSKSVAPCVFHFDNFFGYFFTNDSIFVKF